MRAFREYAIPTIEIDLDDENTSIDEIINLFIDINQQGVKVSRFEVVKALGTDPLFANVFNLIAIKQTRAKTMHYRAKSTTPYVRVLRQLNIVSRLRDNNSKVDRMWERLTEIALFARSTRHRAPSDILKAFIKAGDVRNPALTKAEVKKLHDAFSFLVEAYKGPLGSSRLATDQPQFYTLITSLISTDLMTRYPADELRRRLTAVSNMVDGTATISLELKPTVVEYLALAAKQTTNPDRRKARQDALIKLVDAMQEAPVEGGNQDVGEQLRIPEI